MKRTPDDDFEGRAEKIRDQAAAWVARIDSRGTPEEWAALDAWLAANPRHRAEFLRHSVAWRRADALKNLAPLGGAVDADLLDPARFESDLSSSEEHALDESVGTSIDAEAVDAQRGEKESASPPARVAHGRPLRVVASTANPAVSDRQWAAVRRYRERQAEPANDETARAGASRGEASRFKSLFTSRLAASVAILAAVGIGGMGAWYAVERSAVDVYSTHVGEFHRVSLSDGSTVALNTDTEVRVRYRNKTRHVELVRGEALFEVAKNPERPFDVEAGDTTVRAVGTAFSVRLHDEDRDEQVDVVVSEGRVAINPPSKQTYAAGSVATVRNGRVRATTIEAEDITGKLAWTTGRLVFQGEKLSDVVDEINRYNPRKLLVADPDIAGLRIGGTFQATDPDGFARALDRTFGIKSHLVSRPFGSDVIRLDSGVP
jgi:transmembrane sensor